MNRSIQVLIALILAVAAAPTGALARGFGGFHGGGGFHAGSYGGFHAGGYGGGGFHYGGYGGYHPGGFDAGGYRGGLDSGGFRPGDFDAGGYRAGGFGGFDSGAFRAGGYGGELNRGELSSFLGLPTDGGMHAASGAFGASGAAADPFGFAAGRAGAAGHIYQGPGGTTIAHGTAGARGIAARPGGFAAGGRVASGTAIKTPNGNVYTHSATVARGIAGGPNGVVAGRSVLSGRGYLGAGGTRYFSPTYFHAQGLAASRWCGGRGLFTPGWCAHHPWGWCPSGYTASAWATAAWQWATWPTIGTWLVWNAEPAEYSYGENITYQDGYVYYGAQPLETEAAYYRQASNLASSVGNGSTGGANIGATEQWLSLGVFGLIPVGEKTPEMVFQLAIDKSGTIRGNCYVPANDTSLPVQGALNKQDQRVAWTIGTNKYLIVDTGLFNLIQDHSTALVHYAPDDTVEFVMVRIKEPTAETQTAN